MGEIFLQFVLPSLVALVAGIAGIVYRERRESARQKALAEATAKREREAAEAARLAKQFPGWTELVDENRNLRKELKDQGEKLDQVSEAVDTMREKDSRKMAAVARIFRAIAAQWPTPNGPDIPPSDIAELEDTEVIPRGWIRRSA